MVPLLSPYGEGEIHRREQSVREYSVVPLVFFSKSTVFSKRCFVMGSSSRLVVL